VTGKVKQKPPLRVRRYETYRAMPWRNGRGVTLEIGREPSAGEDFAWRLSLADIARSGDFSAYPGYRRALVLVAGNRLQLRFKGHGNACLDPRKRGTRFDGAWQTYCAIPKGRCTDLSLIVRRGSAARRAAVVRAPRILRVKSTGRLAFASDLHAALFVLQGSLAVTESNDARSRTMRARDTLLLSPGSRRTLLLRNLGPSAVQLILLRWRAGYLTLGTLRRRGARL
jgi:environmental stress-induced protein Ves